MEFKRPLPASSAERGVIAFALLLPALVTWVYFIALNSAPPALQQAAYGIGKAIQFLLPVVWVVGIRREWPRLKRPAAWSLVVGACLGMTIALAMVGLYAAMRSGTHLLDGPTAAVQAKVRSFGVQSPAAFVVLAVFYSAVHSLLEEYYWRWFVFGRLRPLAGVLAAIPISSVGFAAHHVLVLELYFGWMSPLTWVFSLCIAVGGAIWAWLYDAGDSLAATWLSHALVDAAIFGIGYGMIDWAR